jgi:short-subunit dehydrogenase
VKRLKLRNKAAVVTGAAGGIGKETALLLSENGYQVVLADIDLESLTKAESELGGPSRDVAATQVDVSKFNSWDNLLAFSLERLGHAEVLIHCAGIVDPGPITELSAERLKRQIDVNLLGTIFGAKVFLPYFLSRKKGHMIFMGSLGGIVPMPGEAVYSASKFAVRGFSQSLAMELRGTPIRVSVIMPDSVATPQLVQEALRNGSAVSFLGKPLSPVSVARAIVNTAGRRRVEVPVTSLRGFLSKAVTISFGVFRLIYPVLEKYGNSRRKEYSRESRISMEDIIPEKTYA